MIIIFIIDIETKTFFMERLVLQGLAVKQVGIKVRKAVVETMVFGPSLSSWSII